jgi:hypothetical protein
MGKRGADPGTRAVAAMLRSLSLSVSILEIAANPDVEHDEALITEARAAFRDCLLALERVPHIPAPALRAIEQRMDHFRVLLAQLGE